MVEDWARPEYSLHAVGREERFEDPHRAAYTKQGLLGRTLPQFWAYNPAYSQVRNEHAWSVGWVDIMNGMTPEAAAEKAFKRVEEIFAKYPIAQA